MRETCDGCDWPILDREDWVRCGYDRSRHAAYVYAGALDCESVEFIDTCGAGLHRSCRDRNEISAELTRVGFLVRRLRAIHFRTRYRDQTADTVLRDRSASALMSYAAAHTVAPATGARNLRAPHVSERCLPEGRPLHFADCAQAPHGTRCPQGGAVPSYSH